MKLRKLVIENCKSYLKEQTIEFDTSFNVMVGPNGGGKSNTLDIITILLRNLITGYVLIEKKERGDRLRQINRKVAFNNLKQYLECFFGHENEDQIIKLTIEITENDIENINTIIEHHDNFKRVAEFYEGVPDPNFNFIKQWDLKEFSEEKLVTYQIKNGNFQSGKNNYENWFKNYLEHLELFIILAGDIPNLSLYPNYLFFSPYRGGVNNNLQANLSNQQYYNNLIQYFNTTSNDVTSLINLATLYFASKKRRLEHMATEDGYLAKWDQDEEVKLVTKYMDIIGYDWWLDLVDSEKNIYEILLKKGDKRFTINQASSGEKEIFNFLLGIFAFQIHGGIVVIDEPELHLHPKWQNIIRNLFKDLSQTLNNQFILTTHSPTFITPDTLANVRRLSKSDDGSTRVFKTESSSLQDRRNLLHIVNSHNNERMFFADHVVLVEGIHDRVLFKKIFDSHFVQTKLDRIYEVLEVHSKNNLDKYTSFLKSFGVKVSIIADRDYLLDIKKNEILPYLEVNKKKIDKVINDKKSEDAHTLYESLEKAIETKDFNDLKSILDHIKRRKTTIREELKKDEFAHIEKIIEDLYEESIYVLKHGEIEDYLPDEYQTLDGTIKFIQQEEFKKWLNNEEIKTKELKTITAKILGIKKNEEKKKGLVKSLLGSIMGKN